LNAIQALSQLSYGPINDHMDHIRMPGQAGLWDLRGGVSVAARVLST
jgi:hypothetical protein